MYIYRIYKYKPQTIFKIKITLRMSEVSKFKASLSTKKKKST